MKTKKSDSKKGIAIELAIIALVVVFSLTTLIVSISLLQKSTSDRALTTLTERVSLDKQAIDKINNTEETDFTITENGKKLSVKIENGKITQWKYS